MDEVEIVNENDELLGIMSREEAHRNGTPHRIAVIFVENAKHEILIQVRMNGRLDHSSAGHVNVGETYLEAATRELKEELGIENVVLQPIGKILAEDVVFEKKEHCVHMMQVYKCLGEPKAISKEEVKKVYWANPQEIYSDMQTSLKDSKFTGGFRASLPMYLKEMTC